MASLVHTYGLFQVSSTDLNGIKPQVNSREQPCHEPLFNDELFVHPGPDPEALREPDDRTMNLSTDHAGGQPFEAVYVDAAVALAVAGARIMLISPGRTTVSIVGFFWFIVSATTNATSAPQQKATASASPNTHPHIACCLT
jgi:hypothetical protein